MKNQKKKIQKMRRIKAPTKILYGLRFKQKKIELLKEKKLKVRNKGV